MSEVSKRRSLQKAGYVLIRGLVGVEDLAALRADMAKVLAQPRQPGMSRPGNDLMPLRWDHPLVVRALADRRRIDRIAHAAEASDLRWIAGYVSSKSPHTPALVWHQDWWCWDHPVSFGDAAPQVALILAVDATRPGNGALRVLPGSHRRALAIHAVLPEPHSEAAAALPEDHPALSDHSEEVTVSLEAGDAVLLDYRLLHGTHPNSSAVRRDCLLLSFLPHWRALPREVRAHLAAHPALPAGDEPTAWGRAFADLLPNFDGVPTDLPLNRVAPAAFGS